MWIIVATVVAFSARAPLPFAAPPQLPSLRMSAASTTTSALSPYARAQAQLEREADAQQQRRFKQRMRELAITTGVVAPCLAFGGPPRLLLAQALA